MTRARSAPIGNTWTRVVVAIAGSPVPVTHEQIAAIAWPARESTEPRVWSALGMARQMAKAGWLVGMRRLFVDDRTQWSVSERGRLLAQELSRPRPKRRYRTHWTRRLKAKHRRDTLTQEGLCLNGRGHGPATKGRRCDACHETHKRSA